MLIIQLIWAISTLNGEGKRPPHLQAVGAAPAPHAAAPPLPAASPRWRSRSWARGPGWIISRFRTFMWGLNLVISKFYIGGLKCLVSIGMSNMKLYIKPLNHENNEGKLKTLSGIEPCKLVSHPANGDCDPKIVRNSWWWFTRNGSENGGDHLSIVQGHSCPIPRACTASWPLQAPPRARRSGENAPPKPCHPEACLHVPQAAHCCRQIQNCKTRLV